MRYKLFDAFTNKPFQGSSTAVVYWEAPVDRARVQEIARELAVRDTCFLMPPSEPDCLFASLTFTPFGELSICGQGMVAAAFALHDDGVIGRGEYTVQTAIGRRSVRIEDEDGPVAWINLGVPDIQPVSATQFTTARDGLRLGDARIVRARYVDLGRRRLFLQVELETLPRCEPSAARVLDTCTGLEVTGIVFAADAGEGEWHQRHFARSLCGDEDPVTGGAAASLLAFARQGAPGQRPQQLTIHQGGFATRRGLLYARWDAAASAPLVGGRAVKIAEGRLLL